MIPAHLHNLTDAEFVRQFDNTDDPVLKEALRRIEVLRAEEEELRAGLMREQENSAGAWVEVGILQRRIEELED